MYTYMYMHVARFNPILDHYSHREVGDSVGKAFDQIVDGVTFCLIILPALD